MTVKVKVKVWLQNSSMKNLNCSNSREGKASNLTVFRNDEFYGRVKVRLTAENSLTLKGCQRFKCQQKWRNRWTLQHGKIANPDGKFVILKSDIFKKLCEVHSFFLKGQHSPKMHCASRSANLNFMWQETFKKT